MAPRSCPVRWAGGGASCAGRYRMGGAEEFIEVMDAGRGASAPPAVSARVRPRRQLQPVAVVAIEHHVARKTLTRQEDR